MGEVALYITDFFSARPGLLEWEASHPSIASFPAENCFSLRVVHLERSTCHAISGRGD